MPGGRAIAPVLLALTSWACGTIVSGEDLVPADAGTSSPDIGPMDTGPAPDLGCRDITPEAPTSWPFPHTKEAYIARFHGVVPNVTTCAALPGCHLGAAESKPPRIPQTEPELDDQDLLDRAITELWDSTKPKTYAPPSPPSPGPVIGLEWIHSTMGGNVPQQYNMAQLDAVKAMLRQAEPCKWKPAYDRQQAGEFNCVGGTPRPDAGVTSDGGPASDAQVSDAQASDGGDAGDVGPQDATPIDTGPLSGFCDCPVPRNLNFQYCR